MTLFRFFAVVSGIRQLWQHIRQVQALRASRHELAELDDAALKDFGLSRAQAAFEASRHTWDATPWAVIAAPTRASNRSAALWQGHERDRRPC